MCNLFNGLKRILEACKQKSFHYNDSHLCDKNPIKLNLDDFKKKIYILEYPNIIQKFVNHTMVVVHIT